MNYVITDLHGNYEKYQKMLECIAFSDEDTLYILGDVCDRGTDCAKIYKDVMKRTNVFLIKGNHEMMAQEHLGRLLKEYEDEINPLELYSRRELWCWFENGGEATLLSLYEESETTRNRIFEFIEKLPYYRVAEVNGKQYVMIHGGVEEHVSLADLATVDCEDMVWSQPNFDGTYFGGENIYLVVGHTPTFLLRDSEEKATIFRGKGNVLAVDCGTAYPLYGGRLGCLCLETGAEFYV